MAFANRIGNFLKQTMSKHLNVESCGSNSVLYQAIRSMSTKLFVGGLSYGTDDVSLSEAFSQHGQVVEARVIIDRDNGRSRGFGFVTFASEEEAARAMQALDGQDLHGRRIRVNHATERPRAPRYDGGYGGGGGFGYGGSQNSPYGGDGYDRGNYGSNSSYGGGSTYRSEVGGNYGHGEYSSGGNQSSGGGTGLFSGGSTNQGGLNETGYDGNTSPYGNPQEEPSGSQFGSFNVDDEPEIPDGDYKDENDEPNDFIDRKV